MFEYEKNCTLLVPAIVGLNAPTTSELQKRLEDPSDNEKCKALRELIIWMTHGESYNRLLMTVIRYVVQSTNHKVKKYLQLYWEIVEKCNSDGSLKEEMILVCNALRNDLQHPNEYIRGSTLRLLCNLRFIKLIQPLIESILENLQHRHSYVRRNAVMCIYSIIKTFGVDIIPNAVDEVEKLLLIEGDVSTKRNAFLVLTYCDVERSLRYILSIQENVTYMGDVIQMVLLELLGKNYKDHPNYRNNLVQLIINITQSGSSAVSFEGANTLIKIGNSTPNSTIKIALQAYINLLLTHSDNNVRYIVLNKISKITGITSALYILQKCFVKDILRVLLCSNCYSLQIKVIQIMLSSLLTKNNCLDIFQFLLKHLQDVSIQNYNKFNNNNSNNNNNVNDKNNDNGGNNHNHNGGNNITNHPHNHHHHMVGYGNNEFNQTYHFTSDIDFNYYDNTNDYTSFGIGGGESFGGLRRMNYGGGKLSDFQQFQNYQLILIKSLHEITRKYHKVTFKPMISSMMVFLSNSNPIVVNEITQFLKEMVINYSEYQNEIVNQLITHLPFIQFSRPLRTCLWILSECEYGNDKKKIIDVINVIYDSLEPLPLKLKGHLKKRDSQTLVRNDDYDGDDDDDGFIGNDKVGIRGIGNTSSTNIVTKTVILEDGTYATQDVEFNVDGYHNNNNMNSTNLSGNSCGQLNSSLISNGGVDNHNIGVNNTNNLRNIIVKDEDLLLIASIGVSLMKLVCFPNIFRSKDEHEMNIDKQNKLNMEDNILNLGVPIYNKVFHIIVCFLRYCLNDQKSGGIQNDTTHRLSHCYILLKSIYNDLDQLKKSEGELEGKNLKNLESIRLSKSTIILRKKLFPKFQGIRGNKVESGGGGMKLKDFCKENRRSNNNNNLLRRLPYNVINFRQLKEKVFSNNVDITQINDDDDEFGCIDESMLVDSLSIKDVSKGLVLGRRIEQSTSKRIYAITGLSDPIYIEAILQVQNQDVLLELIVTNQGYKAVQNVQIELYPYGNLRVIEKPQNINHLDPGNTIHVYSIAQVKSIETGILFGFVTFQTKNSQNDGLGVGMGSGGGSSFSSSSQLLGLNDIVVLNEINIDLIDFITNSNIPCPLFRQLWSEFEWENKIPIHTSCESFMQFLKYLIKETKLSLVGFSNVESMMMIGGGSGIGKSTNNTNNNININSVISSGNANHLIMMDEKSNFFATNLYARSIFGEDALVNISLEKQLNSNQRDFGTAGREKEPKMMITGTVRIRSRTQGIALSLGDHIVSLQRKIPNDEDILRSCGNIVNNNDESRKAASTSVNTIKNTGSENEYSYGRHSRLLNIDFGEIY
ncbi:coatomer beta subunit [Cryptosporidium sp. chipmunk genotype I]|uniref:coatomer beta subunit n=1 Tax=Cryptosporidium sp. chipmunk genotype I TaxID=1280935 RepID=UPI00351AA92A|nr:coatomer beta subunit [Cryptosporidium sp. chipmunk genotype I]